VEGIETPAEGGRNRRSFIWWKDLKILQKVEGMEAPAESGRNRSSCRRWKK
jgi:hypothetical protein